MNFTEQQHADKHNEIKLHCFRTYEDGSIEYNQSASNQEITDRWGRAYFYEWKELWADCPYWEYYLEPETLPETWGEIKAEMSKATKAAREAAKAYAEDGCVFSTGFMFVAESADGECVLIPADCWNVPTTKKGFMEQVEQIKAVYPTAKRISAEVAYDWARCPHDYYNDQGYDPQVSHGTTRTLIEIN